MSKSVKQLKTHRLSLYCMHTLAKPELSEDKLKKHFGDCGKKHGHNYQLELTHDLQQGENHDFDNHRRQLESYLKKFSGRDLNEVFENTAGEVLVTEWLKLIRQQSFGKNVIQLAIKETGKNRFISLVKAK